VVELVRELASHFGDTPAGWVSDRASFDDRVLDALFEMNRGNRYHAPLPVGPRSHPGSAVRVFGLAPALAHV
jgi:hypothetical protein